MVKLLEKRRFAVIGLGIFGRVLALELARAGAEVIAIDKRAEPVEEIKEEVTYAIQMDATDVRLLQMHGIHEVDAAIVAIGEHFEALVLIAAELLNLNTPRVFARAATLTQRRILQRIGVTDIISPEEEAAQRLAMLLLLPKVLDYLQLSDEYAILEVEVPPSMVGHTLADLALRKRYHINVITIRRPTGKHTEEGEPEFEVLGVPGPDTVLQAGDTLVVFGKPEDVERMLLASG